MKAKRVPGSQEPATAVSLGVWQGRLVLAMAHLGRAEVFDMASAERLGSPVTGRSAIVSVAVGESGGQALLATGSEGGAVTIWKYPPRAKGTRARAHR